MEIITNGILNKEFLKISEYKRDLGLAVKIQENKNGRDYSSNNWVVKDKTLIKYYSFFNTYPMRNGKIGTLLFYVDLNIKDNNVIYVINDDKLYKSMYDKSPIRKFLSDLIKNIIDNNIEPFEKIEPIIEEKVDLKNMSTEELMIYLSKNK